MSQHHSRFDFLLHGEREVLRLVESNLDLVIEASRHLETLVSALESHDRAKVKNEIKTISEIESNADDAHLNADERISSGSFFGGIREDIIVLLEQIDNIADAAKDSSRVFSQRQISTEAIDYLFKRDVRSYIKKLVETDEALKVAIIALDEKRSKAEVIRLSSEVELLEEETDEIRGTLLENLLQNEIRADPLDIIMLKEFLEIADNVADCAEDASDILLVLVAKGYT